MKQKSEIGRRFRVNYDYGPRDPKNALACTADSHVQQHAKEECDINHIMKRYQKTGVLPSMIKQNPQYGDFADAPTYKESVELVLFAQEQFQSLPAGVRRRFQNDPEMFLEFTSDPKNFEEMAEMGLLNDAALGRLKASKEAAALKAQKPDKPPVAPDKGGDGGGASAK